MLGCLRSSTRRTVPSSRSFPFRGLPWLPARSESQFFSGQPDQYAIAVQRLFHVPRRNKDVLTANRPVVRLHESIAVAVAAQDAGNQRLLGGERISAPLHAVDHALRIQLIQIALQAATVVTVQVQESHDVAKSERAALQPANVLQHLPASASPVSNSTLPGAIIPCTDFRPPTSDNRPQSHGGDKEDQADS